MRLDTVCVCFFVFVCLCIFATYYVIIFPLSLPSSSLISFFSVCLSVNISFALSSSQAGTLTSGASRAHCLWLAV